MIRPSSVRVGGAAVLALAATVACTDWDEGAGGGQVVWHAAQTQASQAEVDAGGIKAGAAQDVFVAWDTWKPPPPDVLADASKPDAESSDADDAGSPVDDTVAPPDVVFRDPGTVADFGFDASVQETSAPDAAVVDAPPVEADAGTLPPVDVAPSDSAAPDTSPPDTKLPDTKLPDTSLPDVPPPDVPPPDVPPLDAPPPDVPPLDVPPLDVQAGPDAAPDWQGFDLTFPADAEVFAGVPGDCLSMYLFQSEVCAQGLTNACIDQVQGVGSLWAKALYQPLADCEKAVCVPKCQGLSGNQCLETCIGKYCATQFLGCVANAKSGGQSCPATFECAAKYPEKLQSIAIFCYSNATPAAQKQFSSLIGCTGKPQTDSCTALLAACYGDGKGQKNCQQTFQCITGCKENQACSWACLGQASPQAVADLDAFLDCFQAVCAPKCEGKGESCVNPCLVNECGGPFAKCMSN